MHYLVLKHGPDKDHKLIFSWVRVNPFELDKTPEADNFLKECFIYLYMYIYVCVCIKQALVHVTLWLFSS